MTDKNQEALKEILRQCEKQAHEAGNRLSAVPQDLIGFLSQQGEDYSYNFLNRRILDQIDEVGKLEKDTAYAHLALRDRIRSLLDYLENG